MNLATLCLHISLVSGITLLSLRIGKEAMTAWLALLASIMNLFVLKQIDICGLPLTASDSLVVGYILGLNLMQEFFGREYTKKSIGISFFVSATFVILSLVHLLYQPNAYDLSQPHFISLLTPMPRIMIASLATFLLVQYIDIAFFHYLRQKTGGKYLTLRTALALLLSQGIDTVVFSYLGLYGIVESISSVICFSLLIKVGIILLSTPFVTLSKKVYRRVSL